MAKKIKMTFSWKNWNLGYSKTVKEFDSKEELDSFLDKANSDHSIRKLIGMDDN